MRKNQREDIFYSLPEVWDFCLEKIYSKPKYVRGLIALLKAIGMSKDARILDAGCGSGFPAIDLVAAGHSVIGTDKSSEMVRQIGLNARKRKLEIDAQHVMWSELEDHFGKNRFDLVYCRGNSLVYAASWEQNWIVPTRSRDEIERAIRNFYAILKSGGYLYIDTTSHKEKPHEENIGSVLTKQGPVQITWRIDHDKQTKIRTWTLRLLFKKTAAVKVYPSYSYLLGRNELVSFLKRAGFRNIKAHIKVDGESNYDVFLAQK